MFGGLEQHSHVFFKRFTSKCNESRDKKEGFVMFIPFFCWILQWNIGFTSLKKFKLFCTGFGDKNTAKVEDYQKGWVVVYLGNIKDLIRCIYWQFMQMCVLHMCKENFQELISFCMICFKESNQMLLQSDWTTLRLNWDKVCEVLICLLEIKQN